MSGEQVSTPDWLPLPVGDEPVRSSATLHTPLPDIRINGRELRDLSAEAIEAVVAANDPQRLFCRSAFVVRVETGKEGRPQIVRMTDIHLRGEMTRAANFHRCTKRADGLNRISTSPPVEVARDILSRPVNELGLPPIEGITEGPFLRPDGTIAAQPGYDAATKMFFAPVGNMDGFFVLDRPGAGDVARARNLIDDAFRDFPFADDASRANAFAMFMTPELRPAIRGNIPIALADAPQAGSGKTLLVSIAAEKTSGSAAEMRPAPIRDDEEWRKTLTATIQAGRPLTIFDNLSDVLDSPSLALAVTAATWTDRVLGRTELVSFSQRTIFMVTGNNIALGGDLPRRCYWIRLAPESSEPWRNRQFQHPDLRGWIQLNRGALLSAILTLARAWFVAGCPPPESPVIGSFEEWCRIMGGILQFAGVRGFLGNADELYQNSDPSVAAWEAFLIELSGKMPKPGFKVAGIMERARHDKHLRSSFPEDLGEHEPEENFRRRLGKALLSRAGRRYGASGVHLVKAGTHQGSVVWKVAVKGEKGPIS